MTVKLMIVDDSAFMRRIIADSVGDIKGIEVAGIARNGMDALEKMDKIKPDIITLDIEMPKLNGIETLKAIKKDYKTPVIMLSSVKKTEVTFEALELGAMDFIEKPENLNENLNEFKKELELKINSLVCSKGDCKREEKRRILRTSNLKTDAIVIGSSTGGPKALVYLVENLPKKIDIPIFIVQHMPKGFTLSFAERLDRLTPLKVVEAKDNMRIEGGKIYLAPGDYHLRLEQGRIKLSQEEKVHGVRPAVDYLFETASQIYKEKLVGIILTGMGRDGTEGMRYVKNFNGSTIAQDEETSVVFGMPGSAIAGGVVDEILSLEDISKTLNKLLRVK